MKIFVGILASIISGIIIYIGTEMLSSQQEIKIDIAVMKNEQVNQQREIQEIKNYFGIPKTQVKK